MSAVKGKSGFQIDHGMSGTRTYKIWDKMKQRCLNPKSPDYKNYGARGISIHRDWIDSFTNFYADIGEIPEGFEIDRIDTNKGYFPDNVKFSDRFEQMQNTRKSKWWFLYGEKYKSASDASEKTGISKSQIKRLCSGYTHNETKNWIPPKEGCYCEFKYEDIV